MLRRWILKYFISWNIQNTKQKNRETLSQFNSVLIVLNMMIDDGSIRMLLTFGTYMLWRQGLKEGLWVDFRTRMAPATPIPWHISEPTGFTGGGFNMSTNNTFSWILITVVCSRKLFWVLAPQLEKCLWHQLSKYTVYSVSGPS